MELGKIIRNCALLKKSRNNFVFIYLWCLVLLPEPLVLMDSSLESALLELVSNKQDAFSIIGRLNLNTFEC